MPRTRARRPRGARRARRTPAMVLVSGGGWGIGDLEGAIESALADEDTLVVCITGRNEAAREKLEQRFGDNERVRVLGFTEQMSDWMAAADAMIHATAGLTVLEAHIRGCPVVSYGFSAGHLRANNAAFERFGLAEVARSEHELESVLRHVTRERRSAGLLLRLAALDRLAGARPRARGCARSRSGACASSGSPPPSPWRSSRRRADARHARSTATRPTEAARQAGRRAASTSAPTATPAAAARREDLGQAEPAAPQRAGRRSDRPLIGDGGRRWRSAAAIPPTPARRWPRSCRRSAAALGIELRQEERPRASLSPSTTARTRRARRRCWRSCARPAPPATFFLAGEQVVRRPALAAEIVAAGHRVELHCHRHRNQLRLTTRQLLDDAERGQGGDRGGERPGGRRLPPALRDLQRPPALRAVRGARLAAGALVAVGEGLDAPGDARTRSRAGPPPAPAPETSSSCTTPTTTARRAPGCAPRRRCRSSSRSSRAGG